MPNSPQIPNRSSKLSRRRFNQFISLTAISILASEVALPAIAYADDFDSTNSTINQELYHIFVGDKLAQEGGNQAVTLKSGVVRTISIPKHSKEATRITLENAALNGGDAVVVLHTLYDSVTDIDGLVADAIFSAPLLKATRDRCRDVYQQIKKGDRVNDPQALDVLDTIISGSPKLKKVKNGETIQKRYQLASQNSRLLELQTYIEEAVDKSEISSEQKQHLKGIYQYVRSGEALPGIEDMDALTNIDAIVQGSSLSVPIRQRYAVASAQTRAFTVDEAIQNLIRTRFPDETVAKHYLEAYHQIRLGKSVNDQDYLQGLNALIEKSSLSLESKAIYKL